MSTKQKQKDMQKQSTRELMGINEITDYSLKTPNGELVYSIIRPTNISVLSEASVSARIYALMTVLKGIVEIEMLCLNSKEKSLTVTRSVNANISVTVYGCHQVWGTGNEYWGKYTTVYD